MNYLKSFWKSALWGVIAFILSSMNPSTLPQPGFLNIPHVDKLVHFGLYFVFTILLAVDLKKSGITGESVKVNFIIAAFSASVFGGGMEIVQLLPLLQRSASIGDFIANTAGAISAVVLYNPMIRVMRLTSGS